MNKGKTVILFFGSFNPIHIGHTALAQYSLNFIKADELWFIPTPQNPQKDKSLLWDFDKRCGIIQQSICFDKRFKLCMIEKYLPQKCYTYRTLRALKAIYGDYNFYFLMGADSLKGIESWYNGKEILNTTNIIVYPRNDIDLSEFKNFNNIDILEEAPIMNVSSTMIRQNIDDGNYVNYFLPNPEIPNIFNLYDIN